MHLNRASNHFPHNSSNIEITCYPETLFVQIIQSALSQDEAACPSKETWKKAAGGDRVTIGQITDVVVSFKQDPAPGTVAETLTKAVTRVLKVQRQPTKPCSSTMAKEQR